MRHQSNQFAFLLALLAALCALACSDDGDEDFANLETAMALYPTAFELQTAVMTETCSPNPGVCHQGSTYPDLFTLGNLQALVGAPCNLMPPSPEEGWDGCEREADRLLIGEMDTGIAKLERVAPGAWNLWVGDTLPNLEEPAVKILAPNGTVVVDDLDGWLDSVERISKDQLQLTFHGDPETLALVDSVLATVVPGDPNGNGVWGASSDEIETASLVTPGDRDRSYLWRRIIGDVPGSRMPLANGPLNDPHFLAIGCWIETMTTDTAFDPRAPIDYPNCSFFTAPPSFVAER